jgi:PKD repeat protein
MVFSCGRKETSQPVVVDFSYTIVNNSYTIPAAIQFKNNTSGALFYKWNFEGGSPDTYNSKEPGIIVFSKAGKIKVKLEAWNDEMRLSKIVEIQIDSVVKAKFDAVPVLNLFAPVELQLNNQSEAGTQFSWTFSGGLPVSSNVKSPGIINYPNPGEYTIKLEAKNDRGITDTISKKIVVRPSLSAGFTIEPSFDDDDYEAPLTAVLHNTSVSATTHNWNMPGGTITSSSDSVPSVTYSTPGTYTVTYIGSNGKQTQTVSKTIIVKPNNHLRAFTNIQLGINTAHTLIGSFFSTKLRKVFKQGEIGNTNGNMIDVVYFGLNQGFSFNKFISPDSAANWTFSPIPGATHTFFINKQETCSCGVNVSVAGFDALTDGNTLNSLNIYETIGGQNSFDNNLIPRIIPFKNAAGKNGLIKITQFINAGQQSYIICDIKIQKD